MDVIGWRENLKTHGYFKIPRDKWVNTMIETKITAVRSKVNELIDNHDSPHYLILNNEPWEICDIISPIVSQVAHGLVPRNEWLVFYRHKSYNKCGFSDAHRDIPDADQSTFVDDIPQYLTVWVSLSRATTSNSCLYFLPKDDHYYTPSLPVFTAFESDNVFPHIKCEPAEPGDVFVFSHRVIHWGSAPTTTNVEPRITLTWTMTNPNTFLPVHLPSSNMSIPDIHVRKGLIDRESMDNIEWHKCVRDFIKSRMFSRPSFKQMSSGLFRMNKCWEDLQKKTKQNANQETMTL